MRPVHGFPRTPGEASDEGPLVLASAFGTFVSTRAPVCDAGRMTDHLPEIYTSFRDGYPGVAAAQDQLAEAVASSGGLDQATLRLVKLGIAIGALAEGAVRSNVRKALDESASSDDIKHVVTLAITTVGFPAAVAALGWVDEVLDTTSRT